LDSGELKIPKPYTINNTNKNKTIMKIQNNGFGKDDKVIFPVNFDLKVIAYTARSPDEYC
jgi:hypothetical protein